MADKGIVIVTASRAEPTAPQGKHIPDASKAAGFGPVKSGQPMSQIDPPVSTAGIGSTRQN